MVQGPSLLVIIVSFLIQISAKLLYCDDRYSPKMENRKYAHQEPAIWLCSHSIQTTTVCLCEMQPQSMTVSQWRRNGAALREAPQLCGLTRGLQPDHKREQKQLDLCSHTENSREFQRRLSQKKQNECNML